MCVAFPCTMTDPSVLIMTDIRLPRQSYQSVLWRTITRFWRTITVLVTDDSLANTRTRARTAHVYLELQKQVQPCWILKLHFLTLSRPISLHSHKPPGPHCFEPFTCNVYRSFQPQNMHMCKQFWGKVSTAKIFYDYQTYLWFVWFFLQNEHELKIEEIFLPWKAKHTGKIVAP